MAKKRIATKTLKHESPQSLLCRAFWCNFVSPCFGGKKRIATKTLNHENSRKPSLRDLLLQHEVVTEIFGKVKGFGQVRLSFYTVCSCVCKAMQLEAINPESLRSRDTVSNHFAIGSKVPTGFLLKNSQTQADSAYYPLNMALGQLI